MANSNFFNQFFGDRAISGTEEDDRIVGTSLGDALAGNGGNDEMFGLSGDDSIAGGEGDDTVFGGGGRDTVEGGNGEDRLFGASGNDRIVGNKGNDQMFGGQGNDMLVWNNGDGSDLMVGGQGDDRVQVNFNTDLVNDDLQNKDVAEFSVTNQGVQFARIEVNDQTEVGLFRLDIRETETLETNFGDGDDTAVIVDTVLSEIVLDLDGGDGIDTLDMSQAAEAVYVNLGKGILNGSTADNFENAIGTEFDDKIIGDLQDNVISGLGGVDELFGRRGNDTLIANKGDDFVFGGLGDDLLVWNNGDGSDLMVGGKGDDRVQVNFDTDLVNDDLQNKDVAEFSVTNQGVQFARIEVNDQTEVGLFQLDIRQTETLETNFGDGDDAAVIVDTVLDEIVLDLDGGGGVDLLDLSQAESAVYVDLAQGTVTSSEGNVSTAVNFENITGTAFDDVLRGDDQDNVIRGGAGNDTMSGGAGADTFVFFLQDTGVDVILDFELGVDRLQFATTDPDVTAETLLDQLTQAGDDVELFVNGKLITIEDTQVSDFDTSDFLIA